VIEAVITPVFAFASALRKRESAAQRLPTAASHATSSSSAERRAFELGLASLLDGIE
jgi:hypothetical protein